MTESLLDARLVAVVLAADAFTRYPEDREAWDTLCTSCEQITDVELETLRQKPAGKPLCPVYGTLLTTLDCPLCLGDIPLCPIYGPGEETRRTEEAG